MSADERLQVTLDKIAFELERLALIAAAGAMNADRNPFERQQIDAAKSLEFEPSYATRLQEREELVSRLETELQAAGAQLDVQDERIRTLEAQLVTLDEAQKQLAWKDDEIAGLRRISSNQVSETLAQTHTHKIELERTKERAQELERGIHRLRNERDQASADLDRAIQRIEVVEAEFNGPTTREKALETELEETKNTLSVARREAANSESRANQLHRELETCRRAAADDANYRIESDKKLKDAVQFLDNERRNTIRLDQELGKLRRSKDTRIEVLVSRAKAAREKVAELEAVLEKTLEEYP